jgi:hypothetical protein
MREGWLTGTIQRVLGTFVGKEFRVEVLSPNRGAHLRRGILEEIHVEHVQELIAYDALSLVLKTNEGLKAVFMGSRNYEPRVSRVFVKNPYEGANEAMYFQNVPVSERYDALVLQRREERRQKVLAFFTSGGTYRNLH